MRTLFTILAVIAIGCEGLDDFEEEFEKDKPPELLITECEEDRTRCDFPKEFIEICEKGFWERYTDCFQLDKICFLFEGSARCRDEDEPLPIEVVE